MIFLRLYKILHQLMKIYCCHYKILHQPMKIYYCHSVTCNIQIMNGPEYRNADLMHRQDILFFQRYGKSRMRMHWFKTPIKKIEFKSFKLRINLANNLHITVFQILSQPEVHLQIVNTTPSKDKSICLALSLLSGDKRLAYSSKLFL